jgi:hypothetical protein
MRTRWIVAAVVAAIGLIFIAQGTNILPGSGGMYGDSRWAVVGVVLVAVGAAVGWSALRNRRQA